MAVKPLISFFVFYCKIKYTLKKKVERKYYKPHIPITQIPQLSRFCHICSFVFPSFCLSLLVYFKAISRAYIILPQR